MNREEKVKYVRKTLTEIIEMCENDHLEIPYMLALGINTIPEDSTTITLNGPPYFIAAVIKSILDHHPLVKEELVKIFSKRVAKH